MAWNKISGRMVVLANYLGFSGEGESIEGSRYNYTSTVDNKVGTTGGYVAEYSYSEQKSSTTMWVHVGIVAGRLKTQPGVARWILGGFFTYDAGSSRIYGSGEARVILPEQHVFTYTPSGREVGYTNRRIACEIDPRLSFTVEGGTYKDGYIYIPEILVTTRIAVTVNPENLLITDEFIDSETPYLKSVDFVSLGTSTEEAPPPEPELTGNPKLDFINTGGW